MLLLGPVQELRMLWDYTINSAQKSHKGVKRGWTMKKHFVLGGDSLFAIGIKVCSTFQSQLTGSRLISCDQASSDRPLATRLVRDDDYLPLESDDLDNGDKDSLDPTFRYLVSATSLPGVGEFGREAQAAYLFDKMRMIVQASDTTRYKLYHMGREFQGLLGMVMEQAAGRCGSYCGASQIIIT